MLELATALGHSPIALLGLLHGDEQWSSWALGLNGGEAGSGDDFARRVREQLTASGSAALEVTDLAADERYSTHPLVTGPAAVRFLAAVALCDEAGAAVGLVSVLDTRPRQLTPGERRHLTLLASQVSVQLRRWTPANPGPTLSPRELARDAWSFNTQLLEGVLTASPSAIYAKDVDGRFLYANRALHELLARPDGSLLGMSNWDAFPGLVADQFHRNDREVAASGAPSTFAEFLTHPDGRVHEYVTTKFPLIGEDGRVYAIGGVSTVVTPTADDGGGDSGASNTAPEPSWPQLFEHAPTALLLLSDDATILYANPAAEALCGQDEPLTGQRLGDLGPTSAQAALAEMLAAALAGERVVDEPWQLQPPFGPLDVELSAAVVTDDDGPVIQVHLRDVGARTLADAELRASETRWRATFDASPVGIGLSDEHGRFIAANAALCILLGRSQDDVLGRSSADFTHPDDLDSHRSASRLINDSASGHVRIEKRYVRPDGSVRWAWLTVTHTPGPAGQTWTLAHVQDVTDRISVEQAVRDSEDNLNLVAAVVHDIQSGADARHSIVQAGQMMAEAAVVTLVEPGADPEELTVTASTMTHLTGTSVHLRSASVTADAYATGQPLFIPDAAEHPRISPELLRLTRARSLYVVPVRSAGETHAVLLVAWDRVIETLADKRITAVTLLADQTGVALRQAALLTELSQLAMTDSLTGALNRRAWDQRLDLLLSRAHRTGHPLTIAIADLDHFKRFNDTYGHPAGDRLLVEFAAAVSAMLRTDDTLARWGGEEFAIALPECSAEHAHAVLRHLQAAVPYEQTISIGFATHVPHTGETAAELTERADRALYYGKTHGRNQVHGAPPPSAEAVAG